METDFLQLPKVIEDVFLDNAVKVVFSNRNANIFEYKKADAVLKDNYYLLSLYTEKQVFNKKLDTKQLQQLIIQYLNFFKQINIFCKQNEYTIKTSKKDKIFVMKQKTKTALKTAPQHNRTKNYIISEGTIVPPLVDMGIFTKDGKIVNAMHDKFRQINKMLEIIDDAVVKSGLKSLNIIDFGCGKSYLTFVIYYYLVEIKHINAQIIGLDLKEDVIKNCNIAANRYGYKNLKFYVGDIKDYQPNINIDMVISLHACDTATDYALFNAIKWNAKLIFSVPCCQHEINFQFKSQNFNILNRYGIAKERISALFTDIIRCNMLETQDYKTDLLEFIDLDATPKNLLIRAIKTKVPSNIKKQMLAETQNLMQEYNFTQTLYNLLYKK